MSQIKEHLMKHDLIPEEECEPQGLRYNSGKPQLSLVLEADKAIEGAARVLEHGMEKYARSNWAKGLHHVGIIDCLMRHCVKYLNGENLDDESGLPHVDHLLCNALFLSQMYHTRKDLDDRVNSMQPLRGDKENEECPF